MNFDGYQLGTDKTAVYPGAGTGSAEALAYVALGLAGEAGEVANKIKKIIRDNGGKVTDEVAKAVQAELGDVLWYVARAATETGAYLSSVAEENAAKLAGRKARGTLGGSGDER
jgi:NTP pyrophosphatase (non-canonical NTP hydrolase)